MWPLPGDRVLYVLPSGPNVGEVRPAEVIRRPEFNEPSKLNLMVTLDVEDLTNDELRYGPKTHRWAGNVAYDVRGERLGSWFTRPK